MARLKYSEISPAAYRALLTLETHVRKSGLERGLLDLVYLRVSQINGCAYCIDMHAKDLAANGEKPERLALLVAWREAPLFTPRERIALAYAEAVTPRPRWRRRRSLRQSARGIRRCGAGRTHARDRHDQRLESPRHRVPRDPRCLQGQVAQPRI